MLTALFINETAVDSLRQILWGKACFRRVFVKYWYPSAENT